MKVITLFSSPDRRWTVKTGKTEGSLDELFASVRLMIYYAWMELGFFASGQSNKPEP